MCKSRDFQPRNEFDKDVPVLSWMYGDYVYSHFGQDEISDQAFPGGQTTRGSHHLQTCDWALGMIKRASGLAASFCEMTKGQDGYTVSLQNMVHCAIDAE